MFDEERALIEQNFAISSRAVGQWLCAIPANVAASTSVGQPMSEDFASVGQAREARLQGEGRDANVWRFERYVDEVVATGGAPGRDVGGRPTLYAIPGSGCSPEADGWRRSRDGGWLRWARDTRCPAAIFISRGVGDG